MEKTKNKSDKMFEFICFFMVFKFLNGFFLLQKNGENFNLFYKNLFSIFFFFFFKKKLDIKNNNQIVLENF